MNLGRTPLLAVLVIVASITALISYNHFGSARDDAADRQKERVDCKAQFAVLGGSASGEGASDGEGPGAISETRRHVRDAATAVGVNEPSYDPGDPRPIANTQYAEKYVSLTFETISMHDLIAFLHKLRSDDPSARPKAITLSLPAGVQLGVDRESATPNTAEAWKAELDIAYLLRVAREPGKS